MTDDELLAEYEQRRTHSIESPITGAVNDDTTTYTVMLVPDDPATVLIQEHDAGRLRSVHWLQPAAACELGRLLVTIAEPLTRETIDS